MAQNIKISPSILSADFSILGDEIKSLEQDVVSLMSTDSESSEESEDGSLEGSEDSDDFEIRWVK